MSHRVRYRYDSLSRLVEACYEEGPTVTYSYDRAGNLASVVSTDVEGAPAAAPVPDAPASSTEAWFYLAEGNETGPVSREQLEGLLATGRLSPATFVWRAGMSEWSRAGEVGIAVGAPGGAAPPGAPMTADQDTSWYLSRGGGRYGPFTLQQIRQFMREGQVAPTDLVWHPSLTGWMTADEARARTPGLS
ncbi:MAG: DUF4339 domain-containing protein [Actinobacteria bacterium]|nr:DUF4339 domain-containing protein [Actinomycetota bacterium]